MSTKRQEPQLSNSKTTAGQGRRRRYKERGGRRNEV
nr:MAG TPA: hypothetical protein [Caudoviricetes sp.]